MPEYKVISMTNEWLEEKANRAGVYVDAALDPSSTHFMLYDLIPALITENEKDGWLFKEMITQTTALFYKHN